MAFTHAPASNISAPVSGWPGPAGELRFIVDLKPWLNIGYFAECSGLGLEYDVLEYQEGGRTDFVHKLRGQLKYPNLVLKRGITHESALIEWFFAQHLRTKRPAVTVSLVGPDKSPIRVWVFSAAVPLKWLGPSLNAGSNNVATETLEIAHEGLVHEG